MARGAREERARTRFAAAARAGALAWVAAACSAGAGDGVAAPGAAISARAQQPSLPVLSAVLPALVPRNLTQTETRNESAPRFSPDGRQLSFESRDGSAQSIFLARVEGSAAVQRVSSLASAAAPAGASAEDALLGIEARDESYNTQLSFAPDGKSFVFTGNGRSGVYQLYRGELGGRPPQPLTAHSQEDGHPALSPDGRWLVYVSARENPGKLILRNLESGEERELTQGPDVDLYPVWSPDSRAIAFTSGSNDDHNVFLLPDVQGPPAAPVALTRWNFDDLRPAFSPDGSRIAFYSNYNARAEADEWSILVVPADGSGPSKGSELGAHAVAANAVKDLDVGPAWLPWGHALVYARNLKEEWNPIYVVDTDTREERRIETQTRMNHDLSCSRRGLLAFRAQVASWDDIFVAPLVEMPK